MSRTIKASEFKAKCLAIMDEVAKTGEDVVITKKASLSLNWCRTGLHDLKLWVFSRTACSSQETSSRRSMSSGTQ
jgi:hypothetical protein